MKIFSECRISIDGITKKYGKTLGLDNITMTLEKGTINLIIGPNGSGKTTLLKCIMGLLNYEGKITKSKGLIGFAPEVFLLPEFMNVFDFLVSIGRIKAQNKHQVSDFIDAYLPIFDLEDFLSKPIASLSAGMRQKVNLMQAMIHQPKILLLDEPLKALDSKSQEQLVKILKVQAKHSLIVISTHYPEKFKSRSLKTFYLNNGKIIS